MGLQNQFEIEDFDERKQGILIALAVACPREVVPYVRSLSLTADHH